MSGKCRCRIGTKPNKTERTMQQNINEIEINGIKYVPKEVVNQCNTVAYAPNRDMVIVRCESAGCFFGELKSSELDKGLAVLKDARRLWYWSGAASLSQLAVDGTSKPNECKFPVAVPEIALAGVIEVIRCSDQAVKSLEGVKVWTA